MVTTRSNKRDAHQSGKSGAISGPTSAPGPTPLLAPPSTEKIPPIIPTDENPGSSAPPDPCLEKNWGDPPETLEEMLDWMRKTEAALLKYLTYCTHKAHKQPEFDQIRDHDRAIDAEWANWERETDIQTGEIYEDARRQEMFDIMRPMYRSRKDIQGNTKVDGNESHYALQWALGAYEDFLYYQNDWNRRRKRPSGYSWVNHWVSLFNKWNIGARNDLASSVGPNDVHVYPEGVQWKRTPAKHRQRHLEKKFTRSMLVDFNESDNLDRLTAVNEARIQKVQAANEQSCLPDKLPPEQLKYYSAAEATRWTVPTSWEAEDWGQVIAPVRRQPMLAYEHKRKRYQTETMASLVRTFEFRPLERGIGVKKQKHGGQEEFVGRYVDSMREEEVYMLDSDGQRIEALTTEDEKRVQHHLTHDYYVGTPGTLVGKRGVTYTISAERSTIQGPGRRDRARERVVQGLMKDWRKSDAPADDERYAEFSDDEESSSDDKSDPGSPVDSEEDPNDAFRNSYLEGSGLRPVSAPSGNNPPGADGDDNSNYNDNEGGNDSRKRKLRPKPKPAATDASGNRVSMHKPRVNNERFEAIKNDPHWDLAIYTHTFEDGSTFVQRDRVPAYDTSIPNGDERDPPRKVYPETGTIYCNIHNDTPWKKDTTSTNTNGRWVSGHREWIPTVIYRSFCLDNNRYFGYSVNPHFESVIRNGFQYKDIEKFNKVTSQFIRRSDAAKKAEREQTTFGPWTDGELNVARMYNRRIVLRDGLIQWADNYKKIHQKELIRQINAYRLRVNSNAKPRSEDSIRTKMERCFADVFKQAQGLKAQRQEDGPKKRETVTDDQLRPEDILSEEIVNKKKGKAVTKTAGENTKSAGVTRTVTKSSEKQTSTNTKRKRTNTETEGTQDNAVEESQSADAGDKTAEIGTTEQPRKKKAKKDKK